MATQLEFVVFTLAPVVVLGTMIVYSSFRVYRFNDRRAVLLIGLLSLMTLHQLTEVAQFVGGTYYRTTSPTAEAFESGANLVASVASYLVLQQITELRTTRTELETSNAALRERSSMVSVLHRVLRHNVRNDVNVIAGRAADVRSRIDDEDERADLEQIEETALGLATISDRTQRIGQLLEEDPTRTTELRLDQCLDAPLEQVRTGAPDATIDVETAGAADVVVECPATFPVAVADVVEQIVRANADGVDVEITVARDPRPLAERGASATVVIEDDGDGLSKLNVEAVKYETETPLRHAEGLSLWPLEWAVKRAGGELDAAPDDATVEIRLPVAD